MIDLHSHLLPAVDDGARTVEKAYAVLSRFAADGVRVVACTPHVRASQVRRDELPDHAARFAPFADAWRTTSPDGPSLLLGCELMLDDPGVDLTSPSLRIGDSNVVLVELPHGEIPPGVERELERVRASGVVPLMAHPERYLGLTPARAMEWRAAGAVLQGDASTLCGTGRRATLARQLVAAGAYDVLASDNHGDSRTIAAARDFLAAHDAPDVGALLTVENPSRLLRGEATLPVPPVKLAEGFGAQLRGWLAARLRGNPLPTLERR